jgi:hypothetical protein
MVHAAMVLHMFVYVLNNVMSQLSDWKRAHIHRVPLVGTYNVMSQLSDWKRAHICTMPLAGSTCVYKSQKRLEASTQLVRYGLPFGSTRVRTYVRTFNVMSQLSDWKRAHMCTENHVCTYVPVYVRTYNVMSQLSDWKRAHMCTRARECRCVALHSLPLSTGCRVSSQNTRGSQCTCVPFSNQKVVT